MEHGRRSTRYGGLNMDWKNKVLNPKGWLMAFGLIFILLGTGNYLTAETAADAAYDDDDPTDRDVFYEQTFGLFTMALAVMALTTALVVTGRPLSILAMTSSGVPLATTSPPSRPAPGPRSQSQSA